MGDRTRKREDKGGNRRLKNEDEVWSQKKNETLACVAIEQREDTQAAVEKIQEWEDTLVWWSKERGGTEVEMNEVDQS